MPKTLAERKSDIKYQKENYLTIGIKLYRGDAEAFKQYCAERGVTANNMLRQYVSECLGRPLEYRTKANQMKAAGVTDPEQMDCPED